MKSTKKKLPLWKRVLRAGIGLSVLVLAFAGLVAYAYWFYKEPMARSYYLNELPLTREQFADDFEEIHRTVVERYSLYRQKGIDMDSLHRVYAGRVAQAQTTTDYGKLLWQAGDGVHSRLAGRARQHAFCRVYGARRACGYPRLPVCEQTK